MIFKKLFKRSKNGSVMVEAALVIPLLVGVTFFIIEFGNVLYISNSLSQVARTAARYASVTPAYTQQGAYDASGASSLLKNASTKLTLTITPSPGTAKVVGTKITVSVKYSYTPLINPFGLLGSNKKWAPVLNSASVSRSEVGS